MNGFVLEGPAVGLGGTAGAPVADVDGRSGAGAWAPRTGAASFSVVGTSELATSREVRRESVGVGMAFSLNGVEGAAGLGRASSG